MTQLYSNLVTYMNNTTYLCLVLAVLFSPVVSRLGLPHCAQLKFHHIISMSSLACIPPFYSSQKTKEDQHMVIKQRVGSICRWMFLILIVWCKTLISLKIRTNFVSVVKLSPVYNMASSGLWKMLTFIILNHQNGVWENVFLYNIDTYYLLYNFGRCYAWGVKADVICLADAMPVFMFGRCYSQEVDVMPLMFQWQMLWPFDFYKNKMAITSAIETHPFIFIKIKWP